MTREIGEVIDAAKYDGSYRCELEDKDFDFLMRSQAHKRDDIIIENVHIFRKGKMDEVLARQDMTSEEQMDAESELSRQRREAAAAKKGQLPVQPDPEYHPKARGK